MSPCSHDFPLTSLYVYSNKIIIAVGLTYECLVLDSELSTCYCYILGKRVCSKVKIVMHVC